MDMTNMETADISLEPADHSYSASNSYHKKESDKEMPTFLDLDLVRPRIEQQDYSKTACKKRNKQATKDKQTVENPKFECPYCDDNFTRRFNVRRHIHRYHKGESTKDVDAGSCVCLECGYRCLRIVNLREHLLNCHDITFRMERVFFENSAAFDTWKQLTEEKECCNFVKVSGSKIARREVKVQYFQCNRCGNYRRCGKGERRTKSQGTCKIDRNCTSTMKVTKYPDNSITVDVCFTHYGHDKDPTHIRSGKVTQGLTTLECTYIGKQIHNGHFESFGLSLNSISQVPDSDDKWEVSSKDKDTTYTVRKIVGPICKEEECNTRCTDCSACLHLFVCSCLESLIKDSICKHIHLVQRLLNSMNPDKNLRQYQNTIDTADNSELNTNIDIKIGINKIESVQYKDVIDRRIDVIGDIDVIGSRQDVPVNESRRDMSVNDADIDVDVNESRQDMSVNDADIDVNESRQDMSLNDAEVVACHEEVSNNPEMDADTEIASEVEIVTIDESFIIWMSKTGPVENIDSGLQIKKEI